MLQEKKEISEMQEVPRPREEKEFCTLRDGREGAERMLWEWGSKSLEAEGDSRQWGE